jgi:hypothetical protein
VVAGAVGICALGGGALWRARLVVQRPLFARLRFVSYRRAEMERVRLFGCSTSPVPRVLLPTGRWEPEIARRCFGRLRGAVHGGAARWSMFRPCYQLLLCILTGVPVPVSWCAGYWVVLCVVQAAVAVFVVVVRPSRARFTDFLLAAQMAISCATTAACAAVPHVADNVVAVLMMVAVVFSSLQMIHVALVVLWEARVHQAQIAQAEPEGTCRLVSPNIIPQSIHPRQRDLSIHGNHSSQQQLSSNSMCSLSFDGSSNALTNLAILIERICNDRGAVVVPLQQEWQEERQPSLTTGQDLLLWLR